MLQRKPPCVGQRALERLLRGRQLALCGQEEAPAAGRPGARVGAPESLGIRLVRLEIGTRQLQLAEADECLDGVGPDGKGRIVHSAREETSGEVAEVVTGRLQVAELELEPTQDTERGDDEDLVGDRLGVGEHLVHRGTRVVDETEVGLEERLRPSDPVVGVRMRVCS